MDWEKLAMRQAEVISDLSLLCSSLISELAMYRETDREERRMEDIMKGDSIASGGKNCAADFDQ